MLASAAILIALAAIIAAPHVVNAVEHQMALRRFNSLSQEGFLYDFDYMMRVLEENFPFFDISISANGVDIMALAADVRVNIENYGVNMDAVGFFEEMRWEFLCTNWANRAFAACPSQ